MEEIDHFREIEDNNYNHSKEFLGDSTSLVQNLLELYKVLDELLAESITLSGSEPTDEQSAVSTFLTASGHYLVIAALAMLRGHLTDSFSILRKSIEFSAFAARVKKHPPLAKVWLDATGGDALYNSYQEKFSGRKLFPNNNALLVELQKKHDDCSKRSHGSIYSFKNRVNREKNTDAVFSHFELRNEDPSSLIRALLYAVESHLLILKVFQEALQVECAHGLLPVWLTPA